jgi:translation initiation factor IF-3
VYHPDHGKKILDKVEEPVKYVGRVEIFTRIDGRNMTMVLAPDKRAQAAARANKAQAADAPTPTASANGSSTPATTGDTATPAPAAPDAPEAPPSTEVSE